MHTHFQFLSEHATLIVESKVVREYTLPFINLEMSFLLTSFDSCGIKY